MCVAGNGDVNAGRTGRGRAGGRRVNAGPKDPVERWFLGWSRGVRRRARLIVWLTPLVTVGLALYTARHLGVNTDTSSLVSQDLEYRRVYNAYQRAFPGGANELVVVIEGVTPDIAERALKALAAELATDSATFESVYAPGSGPFFDRHGLLYLPLDSLQALSDRLEGSSDLLRGLDARPTLDGLVEALDAAGDRVPILGLLTASAFAASEGRFEPVPWSVLLTGHAPAPEDRRRILTLRPRLSFENAIPGREALERVREAARRLGLTERAGVRVRLTGSVAIEAEELVTAISGVRRAGLLALVSVALILFLALRSARLILAALGTLVVGLVITGAFAAVAVGALNLISVAFTVLYIGLGIDYGIHLSLRYRARRAEGLDSGDALDAAVSQVGPSLALSALTTAACFYAFIPTDFTGVSELGLIGGTGMFVSFFVTLTVLPALLTVFPLRQVADSDGGERGLPGLGAFVRRWRGAILGGSALATLAALALLPGAEFDHNPLNLRDPDSESVVAYRALLADPVARPLSISVLRTDSASIARVADAVRPLDVVGGTRSIFDFVPAEQTPKLAILAHLGGRLGTSGTDDRASADPSASGPALVRLRDALSAYRWRGTAEERTAARRLFHVLLGWERRIEGWPEAERPAHARALEAAFLGALKGQVSRLRGAALAGPVTLESLPRDLRDRWVGRDGRYRVEILPSEPLVTNERLWRFVDSVRDVIPDATGQAVSELETGRVAAAAFRSGLLWAGLATVILLLGLLRNLRVVALVVGPLVLAAIWTAGLMSWLDLPFNFANVIALPLLLGIGVDNGIHMVHHAIIAPPGRTSDPMAASTSRAVLFATLTTMASFGNLAFATHVGMASMGKLLTIGMTCVLIATLVVLPALLVSWVRPESP